ncbi:hypothetical protein [Variovorax sp. dw_954]|uniref:hypothetical protein n=1 Tax=Variovorax sp. dw_954 TaxID=2720078 RepID=UPI0021162954|nr:hypothetical protein [Variovorax sp. dw_954]
MLSDSDATDSALFDGVDTHYLVLSALDQMMEATTISMGATAPEVLDQLANIAARMKPSLTAVQCHRIASVVLDGLDNKANKHKEFSADYFDAKSQSMKAFRFRLVQFLADPTDVYRYSPTPEGYLVYLGMLDMEPEDTQELMEKMLDMLVKRGRFEQALDIAQRARKLSLEFRQLIRDKLFQAYRAPGSVNWSRDMHSKLEAAREHVSKRQAEDFRMEQAVGDAMVEADGEENRQRIKQLLDTLKGASLIRLKLVQDISASPEQYIAAQKAVFRARRPTGLPDLELSVFPKILSRPAQELAAEADQYISALYPPAWPKLYDLNTAFSVLMERRPEDETGELEDGETVFFEEVPDKFTKDLVNRVSNWARERCDGDRTWHISELLIAARQDGLSLRERRCLVFVLYRSFAESESVFPGLAARVSGNYFDVGVACGQDVAFERKKESQ